MSELSVAELKELIKKYEAELEAEKTKNVSASRERIVNMSAEVVDSNPYRLAVSLLFDPC